MGARRGVRTRLFGAKRCTRPSLVTRTSARTSSHGCRNAGRRLRPWPDSSAALRELGERYKLVALSNATLAELTEISARGRLAWHAVLSGAFVKAYKPSAQVYELAIGSLGLEPSRTVMAAAHAWDLRAAASHGLRTAFISRPGADHPRAEDRFDLSVPDLSALAAVL